MNEVVIQYLVGPVIVAVLTLVGTYFTCGTKGIKESISSLDEKMSKIQDDLDQLRKSYNATQYEDAKWKAKYEIKIENIEKELKEK